MLRKNKERNLEGQLAYQIGSAGWDFGPDSFFPQSMPGYPRQNPRQGPKANAVDSQGV